MKRRVMALCLGLILSTQTACGNVLDMIANESVSMKVLDGFQKKTEFAEESGIELGDEIGEIGADYPVIEPIESIESIESDEISESELTETDNSLEETIESNSQELETTESTSGDLKPMGNAIELQYKNKITFIFYSNGETYEIESVDEEKNDLGEFDYNGIWEKAVKENQDWKTPSKNGWSFDGWKGFFNGTNKIFNINDYADKYDYRYDIYPIFCVDKSCLILENAESVGGYYNNKKKIKTEKKEEGYAYEYGEIIKVSSDQENIVMRSLDDSTCFDQKEGSFNIDVEVINETDEEELCYYKTGSKSFSIKIDNKSPQIEELDWSSDCKKKRTISFRAFDNGSGIQNVHLIHGNDIKEFDKQGDTYTTKITENGEYQIKVTDKAGNSISYTHEEENILNKDPKVEFKQGIDQNAISENKKNALAAGQYEDIEMRIISNEKNGTKYTITDYSYSVNDVDVNGVGNKTSDVEIKIAKELLIQNEYNHIHIEATEDTGNTVEKDYYWIIDTTSPEMTNVKVVGDKESETEYIFQKEATIEFDVSDIHAVPAKVTIQGLGEEPGSALEIDLLQESQTDRWKVTKIDEHNVRVSVITKVDSDQRINLNNVKLKLNDSLGNVSEDIILGKKVEKKWIFIDTTAPRINVNLHNSTDNANVQSDKPKAFSQNVEVDVNVTDELLYLEESSDFEVDCNVSHKSNAADEFKPVDVIWINVNKNNGEVQDWQGTFRLGNAEESSMSEAGIYSICIQAKDVVGNMSEKWNQTIYIDNVAPVISNIVSSTENEWSKEEIQITFDVTDEYPGEVASVWSKWSQESRMIPPTKEGDCKDCQRVTKTEDGKYVIKVDATKDQDCYLHIWAYDQAGNVSEVINKQIRIDVTAPTGNFMIPEKKLSNENVNMVLEASDPLQNNAASGIKEIDYIIYCDGKQTAHNTIHTNGKQAVQETIEIVAAENEGDKVWIEAVIYDQAGNCTEVKSEPIAIDITKPVIQVTYDNNEVHNDCYFSKDRKATIQITEHHFDESLIKIETTGVVGAFSSDGDIHTAIVTFHEDGEHKLEITGTDLAQNEASETIYEGVVPKEFWMDQTKPEIEVLFDQTNNNHLYNNDRIATIRATEENFQTGNALEGIHIWKDDVEVTSALLGTWERQGNIYRMTIRFKEDGQYYLQARVSDMAGNTSETIETEHFTVDQTVPSIKVNAVEDAKAYAKEAVTPSIEIADEHFDKNGIRVILLGAKQGEVTEKYPMSIEPLENGMKYVFSEITEDDLYTIKVEAVDLAGNTTNQMTNNGKNKEVIHFSVNRKGSVFSITEKTEGLIGNGYMKAPQDIELIETNVNILKNSQIIIMRDNEQIETITIPNGLEKEVTQVQGCIIQRKNVHGGWSQYTYKLSASYFEQDGVYRIAVRSEDSAGNIADSVLSADYEIAFVVDQTKPVVIVSDLKEDSAYDTKEKIVSFTAKDNAEISQISVYLNGKQVAMWNQEEVRNMLQKNESFSFMIPESVEAQTVTIECKDAAGNLCENTTFERLYVTTDPWTKLKHNKVVTSGEWVAVILFITGIITGGCIYRKKRHQR